MNKQSLSGAHAAGFAIFCAAKPASAGHHELRAKAVKEDDSVEIIIYNRDSRARKHVRRVLQKSAWETTYSRLMRTAIRKCASTPSASSKKAAGCVKHKQMNREDA